jgi:signal transduction histidine kinase
VPPRDAFARLALAATDEAVLDAACEHVVALGPWRVAAFVAPLTTTFAMSAKGLDAEARTAARARLSARTARERDALRLALERHRLLPDVDVAFVPAEARGDREPVLPAGAPGPAAARGDRAWLAGDELLVLARDDHGVPFGVLALGAPEHARRPSAEEDGAALRAIAGVVAVAAGIVRGRAQAFQEGSAEAMRALGYVGRLTGIRDVDLLLDRIAEICAKLAGYRAAVLTVHMDDGPHMGAWNLGDAARAAFQEGMRGSTLESTSPKRERIRAMAFPGTGIAYVTHTDALARGSAFQASERRGEGTWHPEDRLFVLVKTTQGRDIGVLSLDDPLDGNAPAEDALGALVLAERFLDLGGALLETRILHARAEQAQRLEALGTLAAGIAHDFNNLVGAIMGYSSLLRMRLPEGSEAAGLAQSVERACERAAQLTQRLRALTKAPLARRESVDVVAVLRDCERMARDTFPRSVRVELAVPASLPRVNGDPVQLYRGLMGLWMNARDAMPEGGTLRVTAGVERVGAMIGGARDRRWVCIDVEDDGEAIAEPMRPRVFDPFVRTAGRGSGSGLTLFHSHSVVRAHGGTIDVGERPDGGARFRVLLPIETEERTENADPRGPARTRARILVIEDEPMLRDLLRRGLADAGHESVMAGDGASAMARVREGRYDLVILDLVLPDCNGADLFREIRTVDPHVPVLVSSGNVEEGLLDADLARGIAGALPKPWRIADLQRAVRKTLARP